MEQFRVSEAYYQLAKDCGVLHEAIALHYFINNASNIFQGGFESINASREKFAHIGGDVATNLNVYLQWRQVKQDERHHWCLQNCVDEPSLLVIEKSILAELDRLDCTFEKASNYALHENYTEQGAQINRETIPDVISLVIEVLHIPIIDSLYASLAVFLGHSEMGYMTLSDKVKRNIMTSSVLHLYKSRLPAFAICKTTRESGSIMNTLTLKKEWIETWLEEVYWGKGKNPPIDTECAKGHILETRCLNCNDYEILDRLDKPYVNSIPALEKQLKTQAWCKIDRVFVDTDVESMCLYVTAPSKGIEQCVNFLKTSMKSNLGRKQTNTLSDKETILRIPKIPLDCSDRMLLNEGCVATLMLSSESKPLCSNSVYVFNRHHGKDISLRTVRKTLEKCGKICEMKHGSGNSHFKSVMSNAYHKFWGTVVFESSEAAEKAINDFSLLTGWMYWDMPEIYVKPVDIYSQCLWSRFIFVLPPFSGYFQVSGSRAKMDTFHSELLKDNFAIHIHYLDEFGEATIHYSLLINSSPEAVSDHLAYWHIDFDAWTQDKKIALTFDTVITELSNKIENTFSVEMSEIKNTRSDTYAYVGHLQSLRYYISQMTSKLKSSMNHFDFDINILTPKESDVFCTGYAIFRDTDTAKNGIKVLKEMSIYRCPSYLEQCVRSYHIVSTESFKVTEGTLIRLCVDHENGTVTYRLLTSCQKNHHLVEVTTSEEISCIHEQVSTLFRVEIVHVWSVWLFKALLKSKDSVVEEIKAKTQTFISISENKMSVSIHGSKLDRIKAKSMLETFLSEYQHTYNVLSLRRQGNPPQLFKNFLFKYGPSISTINQLVGAEHLDIDSELGIIEYKGGDRCGMILQDMVMECIEQIQGTSRDLGSTDNICVACLCEISGQHHILQVCHHRYCKECAMLQVAVARDMKNFPILCAQLDCQHGFVWNDIRKLFSNESDTEMILEATILNSVRSNPDKFRFCISPDCPMLYKVTATQQTFQCPLCDTVTCTKCNTESHSNVPCEIAKMMKLTDDDLKHWIEQDYKTRRFCSKCQTYIEKIGGCNAMYCLGCKSSLCWFCLEVFPSESETNTHMLAAHGGIGVFFEDGIW